MPTVTHPKSYRSLKEFAAVQDFLAKHRFKLSYILNYADQYLTPEQIEFKRQRRKLDYQKNRFWRIQSVKRYQKRNRSKESARRARHRAKVKQTKNLFRAMNPNRMKHYDIEYYI